MLEDLDFADDLALISSTFTQTQTKIDHQRTDQETEVALDRACVAYVAYEQPTESTHCLNLGTRREEEQRAAEGDMEKNCRRQEPEDGFCHLEQSCYRCKRQSGLEETSQRPYSPRGDVGSKSSKSHKEFS